MIILYHKNNLPVFMLTKLNTIKNNFVLRIFSSFQQLMIFFVLARFLLGCINVKHDSTQKIPILGTITKFLKQKPLRLSFFSENLFLCVFLGCESERIDQGRSYYQTNISISHCFFSRSLQFSEKGGVIFVEGDYYRMNVNYSMFYNCVCSNAGGAIYFSSSYSYLRMICANKCSCGTSSNGQFAYPYAYRENQVDYLSMSNCSHTTSGSYPIRLDAGNQKIDNTNSSMNNAKSGSGILIYSSIAFTSSHCTYSNNNVAQYSCIHIYNSPGTLSFANIVYNNSPTYGIVYVEGTESRKMLYCIFHNNQNRLFCVIAGTLEVSHSFIDHSSSSFSTSKTISTSTNNSLTNRITYQIQFLKSYYCNAQLPVPVPSPMRTLFDIQTPLKTLEVSPMRSLEGTMSRTMELTLSETPINTINQSPTSKETPKETIPRTYADVICTNQNDNNPKINVIFPFSFWFLTNIY